MGQGRRVGPVVSLAVTLIAACSADDGSDERATDPRPFVGVVEALAADEMGGRNNQTPGSARAQEYLSAQLGQFAEPLRAATGEGEGFGHAFEAGTNILALIPGGERADEYVVLGAHYDHLGAECRTESTDTICNGATDNAAGVAAVLAVGRALADDPEPPSRSVILAFWDAEEDGLLGSAAYVADPVVPLERTVAYLNWDIQGANLTPSLADATLMVGAETGGPNLVTATQDATAGAELQTLGLSLVFGQGRSDHASFVAAGVPSVFFTDSTSSCYHTPQDDASVVDYDKLGLQIASGEALTRALVSTDAVPAFVGGGPPATYEDAVSILEIVRQGQEDLRLLPGYEASVAQLLVDLERMVADGPEAFDEDAIGTLLGGSALLVDALRTGDCDGFLE